MRCSDIASHLPSEYLMVPPFPPDIIRAEAFPIQLCTYYLPVLVSRRFDLLYHRYDFAQGEPFVHLCVSAGEACSIAWAISEAL